MKKVTKRRPDLPDKQAKLEHTLAVSMNTLVEMFPPGTGLAVLAFDFGHEGYMSWVSNARRDDIVRALREMADRLEQGEADDAGREKG